jgi:hypothetical protein
MEFLAHWLESPAQIRFADCDPDDDQDGTFLIADPTEAYVLETAGSHWVMQEVQAVRALAQARVIHQDWDGICHGLADMAIERGWWPKDGSKLDFAGAIKHEAEPETAFRRWGRMSLLLEEQNGHIDLPFLRRMLAEESCDHDVANTSAFEQRPTSKQDGDPGRGCWAGMVAPLEAPWARPPMAWWGLDISEVSVFFPVFLHGELPESLVTPQPIAPQARRAGDRHKRQPTQFAAREALATLQARIDRETDDFLGECAIIFERGFFADLERQTTLFMEHNLEQFEEVMKEFAPITGSSQGSSVSV